MLALCSGIILSSAQRILCGTGDLIEVSHMQKKCPIKYTYLSGPLFRDIKLGSCAGATKVTPGSIRH